MTALEEPRPASPVLGELDPLATLPFGRDSMLRRMAAEPVSFLTVQRALVMDVAHPKVGQGVSDHSRFHGQPWTRLWSTGDAGLRLVFGDADVGRAAARQIYAVHDYINGELRRPMHSGHDGPASNPTERASEGLRSEKLAVGAGEFAAADHYTAHDASLLTWVWATLVDSIEVGFQRWVRPYRPGEADRFYNDMLDFARFFGIPASLLPPDRAAFARYMDDMLDSDAMGVTEASRRMAHDVLFFKNWNVPAFGLRPMRVLSILTLDARLRDRLGLELSPADQRLAHTLDRLVAKHYHRLPRIRAHLPYAYLFFRKPTIGLGTRIKALLP